MLRPNILLLASLLAIGTGPLVAGPSTTLWYRQGAGKSWESALPLGNGRLGAMVYGNPATEHLMFNEDSLWSGWPVADQERKGAFAALQKARALIREGKSKEGAAILLKDFCSHYGYGKPDFGAYQTFFDAWLDFGHDPKSVENYRRDLDLSTGVATVSYRTGGVAYTREVFCSHPDQVVAIRLGADRPGSVSFRLRATSPHKKTTVAARGNELVLSGAVDNGKGRPPGMRFEGRMKVLPEGKNAKLSAADGTISVKNADAVVILVAGATNYRLAYPDYRGAAPEKRNSATFARLGAKSYQDIKRDHIADHSRLFGRVSLDLAGTSRDDLPTDRRLAAYKKDRADRGLEALVFQYGRYLLIASSRPGGLPANLQGLWNNSNKPPWNCDYHLNINLQMNYWPADSTNTSECFEPLARWTADLLKPGAKTAKISYHARGWVVHHSANVWGFTAPGPARGIHMMEAESGAFLCQNIWDHFAFTRDREYLKSTAWPLLKGAAEFWLDNLQEVEGGFLAVNPSYSPEHGPLSDGAYYQTMILWDLFTNCIEASKILGADPGFRKNLQSARDRLQPPTIGRYGQLREWRDPALNRGADKDKHRHVSHLWAVYPGKQIVPGRDPELTAAAVKSMNFRGDAATGWSMGWKINLWARLLDGERVHKLVGNLISQRLYPNLWDSCPPFQIDGNFGYTAGVAEMLVQSHIPRPDGDDGYEIHLLPALPGAWATGSVAGLRARGGLVLDLSWKDGALTSVTVHSAGGKTGRLHYKDRTLELDFGNRSRLELDGKLRPH